MSLSHSHPNRPVWVPDSTVSACSRCKSSFSFELRRHHCRHCGLIFCHYCSAKSRPLLLLGYLEPVRVCDPCFEICSLRDSLVEAVRQADARTTQFLLDHHNLRADDTTGSQTPLLVAAIKGNAEIMRILLDRGADVDASSVTGRSMQEVGQSPRGDSPLHYAAINGGEDCVEMLLLLQADVNRRSARYGETPLHKAILFGRTGVVRQLLAAGADCRVDNDRGVSPLRLCELLGDEDTARVLEEHGAECTRVSPERIMSGGLSRSECAKLLWDIILCCFLYKRPRRARVALSQHLLAVHRVGGQVEAFLPQLCDLALHEPTGDPSLKHALLQMSVHSCSLAFAISSFVRSVQEAAPRVAQNFLEMMETVVFGASSPERFPPTTLPIPSPAEDSLGIVDNPSTPRYRRSPGGSSSAEVLAERREGSSKGEAEAAEEHEESVEGLTREYGRLHCSWSVAPTARERRALLLKSNKFLRVLRELGHKLREVNPTLRHRELQTALDKINDRLPPCLYLPIFQSRFSVFWILSILAEEAKVFSTNKRAPFYCVAEIDIAVANRQGQLQEENFLFLDEHMYSLQENDHSHELDARRPPARSVGPESVEERRESEERRSCILCEGEGGGRRAGEGAKGRGLRASRGGGEEERSLSDIVEAESWWPTGPGLPTDASSSCGHKSLLDETYGESWREKRGRIRRSSRHGGRGTWDLVAFIVKSGDDLRQEQFAMQLISCFHSIFRSCKSNLWLRPYQVVSTADDAGLIEVVPDAISLHALRDKWIAMKWAPSEQNLYSYFLKAYGPEHSASYKQAQRNFIESMAAYAVVCYILKVKDRNDGNLMITRAGHLVHIDFGFMLSNTPGDMAFEQAPFKLTSEYVQVMGGKESASFAYFRELCVQGFLEVRRPQNCRKILFLIEMMSSGLGGDLSMPCVAGQATSSLVLSIKEQFMLRRREEEVRDFVHHLVDDSLDNWYTRQYDNYQTLQKTLSNMFFW